MRGKKQQQTYLHFISYQCNFKGQPANLSYWDKPFALYINMCLSKVETSSISRLTRESHISFLPPPYF